MTTTAPHITNRWCLVTAWTFDDSIVAWDYDQVLETFDTREEAEAAHAKTARKQIGVINKDDPWSWCIGVAIAPEPAPGYAPSWGEEDVIWAESVPHEFTEYKESQE